MIKENEYIVLIVDDDRHVLEGLLLLLEDSFKTISASSGQQAIDLVKGDATIGVVVMDIKMPGMNGLEAARVIRSLEPDIPVIFHTGYPGEYSEEEIDATENPFEYVQKGESVCRLTRAVKNAMASFLAKKETVRLSEYAEQSFGLAGKSNLMQAIYRTINKVAPSDTKVMVLGETGTGKELIARAIHGHSNRCEQRLAIFNCNHKSPDLVESELFGHVKGAFTGAVTDHVGLFEYANGGTVFLDEIGDLDITTQAKVLRVLESGEYQTIGKSPQLKKTNVRVICATHHELEQLVREGKFREDLYYRLKGITIVIPSLRERKEDIPLLVTKFADRFTIEQDRSPVYFDQSAIRALLDYEWPGNVRQLLDTVESLIVLTDSEIIIGRDVENYLGSKAALNDESWKSLAARIDEFRKTCIIEALSETDGNQRAAARLLQVDPGNLSRWIKAFKIDSCK